MKVYTDAFLPYDINSKRDVYKLITQRAGGIHGTIEFQEMSKEHIIIMCPFSGSILKIVGDESDVYWIHCQLSQNGWYYETI